MLGHKGHKDDPDHKKGKPVNGLADEKKNPFPVDICNNRVGVQRKMKAEVKFKNQYGQKQQVNEKPGFNIFKNIKTVEQMNISGYNPYGKQRIDEFIKMGHHIQSASWRLVP